ncbi:hypothetical protein K7472_28930 [Streptomyces sp. PTM05]|uniref:Uncharacterized protein n=1 Tax=Streptantibioticus parmotrematis TaxID=2873249 RepID=A0ABS7R469_9ACTN|nr:hypothetical protein [Streptantibioticus parmotrematis]MBY8888839.1 hypothetical protein [Streptantibioticus parmotrematis]
MKTTLLTRPIANPRRTTLAHLKDADERPQVAAVVADAESAQSTERVVELPKQTANPRRTVLDKLPAA